MLCRVAPPERHYFIYGKLINQNGGNSAGVADVEIFSIFYRRSRT